MTRSHRLAHLVLCTMRLSLALSILTSTGAFVVPPATFVVRPSVQPLKGILDEIQSGAYNLSAPKDSSDKIKINDAYEMLLAELVFSTNDPRVDIINNFEQVTDETFLAWLDRKVEGSKDPEERIALRDLHEMINNVKTTVEVSKLAEARQKQESEQAEADRRAAAETEAQEGRKMSNTDVLRKATQINTATSLDAKTVEEKKKSFYEQELTPEIRMSYESLLKKVMPPYKAGDTYESIVFKYYDQFDAQFVKVVNEKADNGDEDAKKFLFALAKEQQKKIEIATNTLKEVLALGDPMRMEGAIVKMTREGKTDEAFLLLLEANADQARKAGAEGPANVMERLRKRAMEEKDKQASSKEIRLVRQLLRTKDAAEREKIIEEAFTPRENLLVAGTSENARKAVDGELPEEQKPMPDVSPPDFINACRAVLLNFGNLGSDDDRGDLASRIKAIASEAEVVATRIFGKGMTIQEQQDRAWKEQTTSIFDLEHMEIEAERMGDRAPWTNPDKPDDYIPGFDSEGRMQIGGT